MHNWNNNKQRPTTNGHELMCELICSQIYIGFAGENGHYSQETRLVDLSDAIDLFSLKMFSFQSISKFSSHFPLVNLKKGTTDLFRDLNNNNNAWGFE